MSSVIFLVDHSAGKVAKATGELATFAKSIGESVAVVFASNPAEIISQLNTFTIDKVIKLLEMERPASIEVCATLFKKEAFRGQHPPKYFGFEIPAGHLP